MTAHEIETHEANVNWGLGAELLVKGAQWFPAAYRGYCAGCGERFDAGDQIKSDGDGRYLAECCEEEDHEESYTLRDGEGRAVRKIVETICGKCNITKPCFCE